MKLNSPWVARWAVAIGLAATLAVWPLGCAMEDEGPPAPPEGVELAKLDYTLKDMMLINFWATWCGPCKHEIPSFVELQEKYKDQKFIVLGISTDDKPEDLIPFAAQFKMNYPVLVGLGHDDLQEHYGTYSLPVSWFIRADGSVDYKHSGTQSKDWFEGRIKKLFEPRSSSGTGQ